MYARGGITVSVGCTMMAWLTAGLVAAPISAGMLEQRQLSDRVIALTTPKTELSGLPWIRLEQLRQTLQSRQREQKPKLLPVRVSLSPRYAISGTMTLPNVNCIGTCVGK
jgi:hypothetical protein